MVRYLNTSIGVVHQHIQPAFLLSANLPKQLLDVVRFCGVADNRHAFSTPLLYLEPQQVANPISPEITQLWK